MPSTKDPARGVRRRRALAVAILALLPAGCMVGPDFKRPDVGLPQEFVAESPGVEPTSPPVDLDRWWDRFEDPLLSQFIADAERGNLQIQSAIAVIETYRAGFGIAESQLYPSLSAGAGYSYIQTNSAQLGGSPVEGAFNAWQYGLSLASWEIDLFGKIRRGIEAARGRFAASVEDWRATLVSLRAEVAQAYLTVRVLQQRRANLASSVALLERQLEIVKARSRSGTVGGIDLAEAAGRLALVRAEIPQIDAQIAEQTNGLSVLLGEYPGEVARLMAEPKPIPQPAIDLALGVPADLLLRRADVLAAERRMAAQVAMVGVATAGLYPEVTLFGGVQIFSNTFSGLGSISNLTYALGPRISWNFFNGGLTESQIKQAEAAAKQAEIAYRQVVLQAVSQVETAAGNVGSARRSLDELDDATTDAKRATSLASRQYEAGTIDLSRFIKFQETLLDLEDAQAQAQGFYAQNLVELYRSLGGGWEGDRLPEASEGALPSPTSGEAADGPSTPATTPSSAPVALAEPTQ